MPPDHPIRRLICDAALASIASMAVVAGHRLTPPAASVPPPTNVEVRSALDAVAADADAAADAGAVEVRVYDVRDLLAYRAMLGEVDGPGGFVPRRAGDTSRFWSKSSVFDGPARDVAGVLDALAPPPPAAAFYEVAGGRLLLARTPAGHARVAAALRALRLVERARAAGVSQTPPS